MYNRLNDLELERDTSENWNNVTRRNPHSANLNTQNKNKYTSNVDYKQLYII